MLDTLIQDLQEAANPTVDRPADDGGWQTWLLQYFPEYFIYPGKPTLFAGFHEELWNWVWAMRADVRPDPFVAIWPREAGKSTNAELACIAVGHRRVKKYIVYVSGTQDQANDHVGNIASALEQGGLAEVDVALCNRRIGKYGQSKGWSRNRLRTRSGLTIDAVGLDAMGRGAKIDNQRPDFIVFDDIDKDSDTEVLVKKKINAITKKILPSGAPNLAVLAVQNLVHGNSVFARLTDGRAGFLSKAKISGPHPAIRNLTYVKHADGRATITGGTPTWPNLSLERCQQIIDDIGLAAFLAEYQHDKSAAQGSFFEDVWVPSVLVVEPFRIPAAWLVNRSFDYGYAKPFSVGWWAESDGETPAPNGRVYPRGTLFRIHEWYGWNGKPNQGAQLLETDIADTILAIEAREENLRGRSRPGPADPSIWSGPPESSIATKMSGRRCYWIPALAGPGSRVAGGRLFRQMMRNSNQTPMTEPGIFFFSTCQQAIRCLPQLPRDKADPDDVDTGAEDHNYDESRYRITWRRQRAQQGATVGSY